MLGFVNAALEKLIRRRFGDAFWEEIMSVANTKNKDVTFQTHQLYEDADTEKLVKAASEILGLDANSILEMFGEQFLLWCQESGYAKTLQLLGRSLKDFIGNLDALHDHLSITFGSMQAPSFRCTESEDGQLLLHYYSKRKLDSIVIGVIKSVSRELYGLEVAVSIVKTEASGIDHTTFSIEEVGPCGELFARRLRKQITQDHSYLSLDTDQNLISCDVFCNAFPFHVVFDYEFKILQVGKTLRGVLAKVGTWTTMSTLLDMFNIERPKFNLTFDAILHHINTVYVLSLKGGNSQQDELRLIGQMIHLPHSNSMLFLCSPRIKNLDDLEKRSLFISDIPIHDATRLLIIMSVANDMRYEHALKLEEAIGKLEFTQLCLEHEKSNMKRLLTDMLPLPVAETLMAGKQVEAQRFQSVTILFSDIVGFTTIGQQCVPGEVVVMLNSLYTLFDEKIGQNGVYKVETIGDAYMVVGGLPIVCDDHAEKVCNQGLDMVHCASKVKSPVDGTPIKIRVGIHSGMVAAGVVGLRMPRYCLFGDTVNIASRCEGKGEAGKVHVTEHTYKLLKDNKDFEFEYREDMEFKGALKPVATYWLLRNKSKHRTMSVNQPIKDLQRRSVSTSSSDSSKAKGDSPTEGSSLLVRGPIAYFTQSVVVIQLLVLLALFIRR